MQRSNLNQTKNEEETLSDKQIEEINKEIIESFLETFSDLENDPQPNVSEVKQRFSTTQALINLSNSLPAEAGCDQYPSYWFVPKSLESYGLSAKTLNETLLIPNFTFVSDDFTSSSETKELQNQRTPSLHEDRKLEPLKSDQAIPPLIEEEIQKQNSAMLFLNTLLLIIEKNIHLLTVPSQLKGTFGGDSITGNFLGRIKLEEPDLETSLSTNRPLTSDQKSILSQLKSNQLLALNQKDELHQVEERSGYVDKPVESDWRHQVKSSPFVDFWEERTRRGEAGLRNALAQASHIESQVVNRFKK